MPLNSMWSNKTNKGKMKKVIASPLKLRRSTRIARQTKASLNVQRDVAVSADANQTDILHPKNVTHTQTTAGKIPLKFGPVNQAENSHTLDSRCTIFPGTNFENLNLVQPHESSVYRNSTANSENIPRTVNAAQQHFNSNPNGSAEHPADNNIRDFNDGSRTCAQDMTENRNASINSMNRAASHFFPNASHHLHSVDNGNVMQFGNSNETNLNQITHSRGQLNETEMSHKSGASQKSSLSYQRQRLEVELEFARRERDLNQRVLDMERQLEIVRINDEHSKSSSSRYQSFSNSSQYRLSKTDIANWVNTIPSQADEIHDSHMNHQHSDVPKTNNQLSQVAEVQISRETDCQSCLQADLTVANNKPQLIQGSSKYLPSVNISHSIEQHNPHPVLHDPVFQSGMESNHSMINQHSFSSAKSVNQIRSCSLQCEPIINNHQHFQLPSQYHKNYHPFNEASSNRDNVLHNISNADCRQIQSYNPATHAACRDQSHDSDLRNWMIRQSISTELPQFSGNPLEWYAFITQFNLSSKMCSINNCENLLRLQKSLVGNAKKAVESLLIFPQNVDKIIEILETRFGHPDHIIYMLLEKVRKLPLVQQDKIDELLNFYDNLTNLVYTLDFLNQKDHIRNPILYREVLDKLPMSQKMSFVQHYDNLSEKPVALVALHKWLGKKVSAASQLVIPTISNHEKNHFKKVKSKGFTLAISNTETSNAFKNSSQKTFVKKCIYCKKLNHMVYECNLFKNLEIDKKWHFVTQNKICFSCLSEKHNLKSCKFRKNCSFTNCDKPHHPLLHKNLTINTDRNSNKIPEHADSSALTFHISNPTKTLLKIIPVQLKGPNSMIDTFALFDEASTVTLIEKDVADDLGLEGPKSHLKLKWTNNVSNDEVNSQVVSLSIKGQDLLKSYTLRNVRTIDNLSLPIQSINVESLCHRYPYMNSYKNLSYENAQPTILIGQDNWPIISTRKLNSGSWNGPAISKTLLGWTIHGNISCDSVEMNDFLNAHVYNITSDLKESDDLKIISEMLKYQWNYDICGTQSKRETQPSLDDKRCLDILNRTVVRVGDKFQSGLLWKQDDVVLPESKTNAIKRLQHLERKMDKNPDFAQKYVAKMNENIQKGYLKKLTVEEALQENPKTWYLPHFGIFNPNKPEKLRIVFDAAAKSHGMSLNDFLLPGIDYYNSLTTIIMNFRINQIAFVADIKEMFLQIFIQDEDKHAQRILWRGYDRDREFDVYEIQVVFFGASCSPCIAQEIKNKNAREFAKSYPEACQDILNAHYMDDYLGGANTLEEAIKLVNDVISVHKRGNFEICNWISNSKDLMCHIDEKLRAPINKTMNFDGKNDIERILGIFWNYSNDTFSFNFNFNKINPAILNLEKRPTKRDILKIIMSIFDPLGFISHFVIVGKILMQSIWESGINWDDEISDKQNMEWIKWRNQFSTIASLAIPRILTNFPLEIVNIQLHIFCDASIYAYATVAYLRFEYNHQIEVKLIISKARVAPLKPMSVPRLELQAAVLAARLSSYIRESLKINITTVNHWSDSKTVLYWINSSSRRFKIFVGHRLEEIQELTDPKSWRYVPSKINVSDDATKLKKVDFSFSSCWFTGPDFLYKPMSEWPHGSFENIEANEEEIKIDFLGTVSIFPELPLPDIIRFSKYCRFLRATAWVIRAVAIKFGKLKVPRGELLPHEIAKAEIFIFKKIQVESYSSEIDCIRKGTHLSKSSPLNNLNLFFDENGVLRLTGRLNNAHDIDFDSKHPILLSSRHPITKLLIADYHEKQNHIGTETVISEIRKRFWMTGLRHNVKRVACDCLSCKIRKSKPKMGQLPPARIDTCVRPFIKTGVDLFGPIDVLVNRRKVKRYGAIFTCMAMRAIHLEIVEDLSSNSFIHVLRQFGARRGFPEYIFSDRGTNFIKANKELNEAYKMLESTDITNFCTMKRCRWVFNPPASPHMGGAWERLIKTTKKHLSFVLISKCPKEFVLRTLFYEIEHIINSRPITYNSSDPNDPRVLCPNDLLIGASSINYQPAITDDKDLCILSHWRAVQRLADVFWQRWVREYIPNMLNSRKWSQENENLKLNDIVIVVDPSMPRNVWPKGKVVQVFPAADGRVRVVDVQTSMGVYKRPVAKLIKLDILNKSNSF